MPAAALPHDEQERLRELRSYCILETGAFPGFDALAKLASFVCGTPEGYVSLIDSDRQVFKGRHGPLGPTTPREVSFCAHAILGEQPLIVPDAMRDARFADNPLVNADPNIRFYAGVPLQSPAGLKLGTLCVIDQSPRTLTSEQVEALRALARQVELQLDLHRHLCDLVKEVTRPEKAAAPVQVGGDLLALAIHDLKNPLTAVLANGHYVLEGARPGMQREAAQGIVEGAEVATRMISDLLDVTLAQTGRMPVRPATIELAAVLQRLRRAMSVAAAERSATLELPEHCDPAVITADHELLRRMLENLVENALKYTRGGTVALRVRRSDDGKQVELSVADQGPGIDPALAAVVFEPRVTLPGDPEKRGRGPSRGLGLYFCRLAAEAMGGSIHVEPNQPKGARFVVRLPLRPGEGGDRAA